LALVSLKADRSGGRTRLIAKAPLGELADEILLLRTAPVNGKQSEPGAI